MKNWNFLCLYYIIAGGQKQISEATGQLRENHISEKKGGRKNAKRRKGRDLKTLAEKINYRAVDDFLSLRLFLLPDTNMDEKKSTLPGAFFSQTEIFTF